MKKQRQKNIGSRIERGPNVASSTGEGTKPPSRLTRARINARLLLASLRGPSEQEIQALLDEEEGKKVVRINKDEATGDITEIKGDGSQRTIRAGSQRLPFHSGTDGHVAPGKLGRRPITVTKLRRDYDELGDRDLEDHPTWGAESGERHFTPKKVVNIPVRKIKGISKIKVKAYAEPEAYAKADIDSAGQESIGAEIDAQTPRSPATHPSIPGPEEGQRPIIPTDSGPIPPQGPGSPIS
ncbi:MAG TPA: hypothetical protein VFX79_00730 [Candidatus Saccharimonadales bacterium]|nr:hypothetical protein [Candidatus Saccharimonadales bacterium]